MSLKSCLASWFPCSLVSTRSASTLATAAPAASAPFKNTRTHARKRTAAGQHEPKAQHSQWCAPLRKLSGPQVTSGRDNRTAAAFQSLLILPPRYHTTRTSRQTCSLSIFGSQNRLYFHYQLPDFNMSQRGELAPHDWVKIITHKMHPHMRTDLLLY